MPDEIDIREDYIAMLDAELLNILLKDHTTSKPDEQHNIFWATTDYGPHRAHLVDIQHIPQSRQGDCAHTVARGKHASW